MKYLLFISISIISVFNFHGDAWASKWIAWEVIGTGLLAIPIYKRYGILAASCFAWPIISAIFVFDSQLPFTRENAYQMLSVENVTLRATFCWIISVLGICFLKSKDHETLEDFFGWFCLANSAYVIYQTLSGLDPDHRFGLIGTNASLNGCIIAVTLAFLTDEHVGTGYQIKKFLLILPVAAIFLEGASIPIGVLAVVYVSFFLREKEFMGMTFVLSTLSLCAILLIPDLFDSSGRFDIWKMALDWWNTNANHWIGSGNGTFFIIGPLIQKINHRFNHPLFIWAHNDWLQTLIEQGYIGLLLFMALFAQCLRNAWKQRQSYLFAGIMGYGACSFFNFPAHSVLFALVGVLLTAKALDLKTQQ